MGPGKIFLPLSAFFLQMSGSMDGDGGEEGIVGYRRQKKKKATKGKKTDANTPQEPKTQTHGGSGSDDDAIGKDATEAVQTSAQVGGRYAKMMALINVGGNGGCKKCGSEPGVNIDCKVCMETAKTEMTTSGAVLGPVKQGATHAGTGGVMGTGNIATAPVPIGTPLRRVAPVKRKKKKQQEWSRVMALTTLNG
jgi:hypothetical protein